MPAEEVTYSFFCEAVYLLTFSPTSVANDPKVAPTDAEASKNAKERAQLPITTALSISQKPCEGHNSKDLLTADHISHIHSTSLQNSGISGDKLPQILPCVLLWLA